MKLRKLTAILLAVVCVCSVFSACSKEEPANKPETTVAEVIDADDKTEMDIDSDEKTTVDITDNKGNVLTIVPVYNSDGSTVFAGYVEIAKDKAGKALDGKTCSYLKKVIAINVNAENNFLISYDEKKNPVVLDSVTDNKTGYIIAIQDKLDLDKDKDTKEYFKSVTIIDDKGNIFIKLDKDEKGRLVNADVDVSKNGEIKVTTADGKIVTAKKTEQASNLKDVAHKVVEEKKEEKAKEDTNKQNSNKPASSSGGQPQDNKPSTDENPQKPQDNTQKPEPQLEYNTIVLKSGNNYATDADNVTGKTNSLGTFEIKVDGPGKYNKYVVTSDGNSTFTGKLEFELKTTEEVEVKFMNVNISTNGKTAVKFTNLDRVVNKDSDAEGNIGSEGSDAGTAVDVPAPKVEVSFPEGTTSKIKANGSGTNGSLYSECKLGLKGYGTAQIDGGQNLSGICCTESIKIKNVKLNILSDSKQGISCDKKVTVESGTINIKSKGDCIHCNKFEMYGGNAELNSLNAINCSDGIDSNDYILIKGGELNITALTQNKYSMKVRKIVKENPKGYFQIDGGKVVANGGSGQIQKITGAQKTVFTYATGPTQFTAGNYKSANGAISLICSPCDVSTVTVPTDAVARPAQATRKVNWSGNYGQTPAFLLKK